MQITWQNTLHIIEWPNKKKARLVYLMSCAMSALIASIIFILLCFREAGVNFASNVHPFFAPLLLCFFALYALFCFYMGRYHTKRALSSPNRLYTTGSMLTYVMGNMAVIAMLGPFSIGTGIGLAGGPMVGILLFQKRDIAFPIIFGFILVIFWYLLCFWGELPQTLLLLNNTNRHYDTVWLFACWVIYLPHVICIITLAWVYVLNWKKREHVAKELAQTDPLTKLSNRRHLMSQLDDLIKNQSIRSIGVLILDLDNFKEINDLHCHQVGDWVLIDTVKIIKKQLSKEHLFARQGGEEFCILMPNVTESDTRRIAQKCCRAIELHPFSYKVDGGGDIHLNNTLSIGCYYHEKEEQQVNPNDLIKRADLALYTAKRSGKNTFVSFTPALL